MANKEPDFIDYYESGIVELRVYNWEDNPGHHEYWLKVGVGALRLRQGEFNDLLEIIDQYYDENIGEV